MKWAVRTSSSSPPTPLVWWARIKPICLLEPSHYSFSTEITINQRLSEEVISPSNFMSAGRSCQVFGVCSPCWEQNCCCYGETSRDRKKINWEKNRHPPTCLSSRKYIWRHNRWGKGRKITLINKETRKRRKRTVSRGTLSHENSAADVKKRFCF